MCGICGFAGTSGWDLTTLRRMTDAMVHRGPDDAGHWVQGDVGLGVRRLAIVDVAHSRQPLSNEDGTVHVVVNGEIYNYRQLRQELARRGHTLRTQGDGEVLAHLYEEVGMDLVHRLRGMYAFALYDARQEALYLARDPFGIKPMFLAEVDGGIAFASDVRALLASGRVAAAVRPWALWQYLTYQYVPGAATLWQGIRRLLPGYALQVRGGRVREWAYFRPQFAPDPSLSLAQAAQEVRRVLEDSVRHHLVSDVPVGAFLSGGVDSSAIVALAVREAGPLDTFSVGFEGAQGGRDERSAARVVAAHLGTRHHEVYVSAQAYADAWVDVVASQEDPVADPSAPGLYFLAREARRHVRVVLSGEGADEFFGGYPIYRQPGHLRPVASLPPVARHLAQRLARRLPPGTPGRGYVERATTPLERLYLGGAKLLGEDLKRQLAGTWAAEPDAAEDAFQVAAPWYRGLEDLDEPTRMQFVDLMGWLPGDILAKADKMTMAHSVELRVPFVDRQVWEVARRIPTPLKLRRGTTKFVLREAVADLLPPQAWRRPKLGFPVPLRHWLRGPLRAYVWDVAHSGWPEPWLSRPFFETLLRQHESGAADWSRVIYAVVTFALWVRTFAQREERVCPVAMGEKRPGGG